MLKDVWAAPPYTTVINLSITSKKTAKKGFPQPPKWKWRKKKKKIIPYMPGVIY